MIWEGHQTFGDSVQPVITVSQYVPQTLDSQVVQVDIPSNQTPGQYYHAYITMKNTGSVIWNQDNNAILWADGYTAGDAWAFGSQAYYSIPGSGVYGVGHGSTYTFEIPLYAPATPGTYHPSWTMHINNVPIGQTATKTVVVAAPPAPNAVNVSDTLPAGMLAGSTYNATITLQNTGNVAWSAGTQFRLGAVGDGAGDASLFGATRFNISAGTTVQPGQSYAFSLPLTAPAATGTYNMSYRMVWEGHQWFGSTVSKTVFVDTIGAQYLGDSIPSSMYAGQSYYISITLNNPGTMPWSENNTIRLAAVGGSSGDAARFSDTRIYLPQNTTVNQNQSYTFDFTMTAPPVTGNYNPSYQMIWEGRQSFGDTVIKAITVSPPPVPNATYLSDTIPSNMTSGQAYNVSITLMNNGSLPWSNDNQVQFGAVGTGIGDAEQFGPIRYDIPSGTIVQPNQTYIFNFTMTASSSGTYHPSYGMVWKGYLSFGDAVNKTITVNPSWTPGANFTATPASGNAPLRVQFNDTSTNAPASWTWCFGDGTANNTLQNTSHIFANPGVYNVTLNATNAYGSNASRQTVMVYGVKADYTGNVTAGNSPLCVQFSDRSIGLPAVNSWQWSWGDGTGNGTTQNPVHTFAGLGTYTVTLTASNGASNNTAQKTAYVTVLGNASSLTPPVGYNYSVPHYIAGSSDSYLNNYQLYVDVYNAAGASGGNTFFTQGHAANFPYDFLVRNSFNNVTYPGWIEEGTRNSTYARIWYNVTDGIPATGKWVYFWYGNGAAASSSNIKTTFYLGDDFSATSLNTTLWAATNNVTVVNGVCYVNNSSTASPYYAQILTKSAYCTIGPNTTTTFRATLNKTQNTFAGPSSYSGSQWALFRANYSGGKTISATVYNTTGSVALTFGPQYSEAYHVYAVSRNGFNASGPGASNGSADFYIDGAKVGSANTYLANTSWGLLFKVGGSGNNDANKGNMSLDWAFVRNFTAHPPANDACGPESVFQYTDFLVNKTVGFAPLVVQFTDRSYPVPVSWQWNFGDGTANGTTQNPAHTYAQPGYYTVTLTTTNGSVVKSTQKLDLVTATGNTSLLWIGNATAASGNAVNLTVNRTMSSKGIVMVDYATQDDTGRAGIDYVAKNGTLIFYNGESSKNITVQTMSGNATASGFKVTLSNPRSNQSFIYAHLGFDYVHNGTVLDLTLNKTGTVTDMSGKGNNAAVVNGGPKLSYNSLGVPMLMFGGTGYLSVAASATTANIHNATYAFAFTPYITYIPPSSAPILFNKNGVKLLGLYNNSALFLEYYNTSCIEQVTSVSLSTPGNNYFAASFNDASPNNNASIYVGEVKKSISTWVRPPSYAVPRNDSTASTYIGYPTGNTYTGGISVVRWYDHILNDSELQQNNMADHYLWNGTANTSWKSSGYVNIVPSFANFTSNVTTGFPPLCVQFWDNSTNATAWQWNFGDGTANSTVRNPAHTYNATGVYAVTLTCGSPLGNIGVQKAGYITVSSLVPVANFTATPTSGTVPLAVQFNDTSSNVPTSWQWNFGDGTANSTVKNPQHTYNASGTYNVTLTSTNVGGSGSLRKVGYITVTVTKPVANFTATPTTGTMPLVVQFNDTSSNTPTSWQWNFGDGTANATIKNPQHTYNASGTYSVTLTASNAGGSGSVQKVGFITVTVPKPVANFSATPVSGLAPLVVQFNDSSSNVPTSWQWSFGDGTANSTVKNPQHTYASAGTYTVLLTATNAGGSGGIQKVGYIVVNVPKPVANLTGLPTSGTAPLAVQFSDSSSNVPTSWQWSFGDGTANSTVQNPVHTYNAAGTYNVTLTATNAGGSGSLQKTGYIVVTMPAPVAGFTATPTSGNAMLAVQFTDTSTNAPTSWQWNFGDGMGNSTAQNPQHTYMTAGTYTVTLTATNAAGSGSLARAGYITVTVDLTGYNSRLSSIDGPAQISLGTENWYSFNVVNSGTVDWHSPGVAFQDAYLASDNGFTHYMTGNKHIRVTFDSAGVPAGSPYTIYIDVIPQQTGQQTLKYQMYLYGVPFGPLFSRTVTVV